VIRAQTREQRNVRSGDAAILAPRSRRRCMVRIRVPSWRLRSPCSRSQTAFRPSEGSLPTHRDMGPDHLLVERIDQQRSQVFRAQSARVAAPAFLENAMHRRRRGRPSDRALSRGRAPAILANPRRTDAKRRSDGFRVSLQVPCRAIDSAGNLRARCWSEATFRRGRVQNKFFTLSFPERQGKGGAALPCRLSPLRRRRRRRLGDCGLPF
jgi:hypothetical protein